MTTLHALSTRRLLHAEETAGERNEIGFTAYLTDESGNRLTDQAGNYLTAWGVTPVIVLHAPGTRTLLHGEDSDG